MFSFELSPETLRSRVIADVRAYSVSESKGVVTSRSFAWIGGSFVPENLYWPMPIDTPGRRRAFFAFASKALDRPGLGLDAVLPPELLKGCRSVCWAYKPPKARVPEAPNSIYLSTLTLEGLSTFLARHGYEGMTAFGSCEAGRLDHLLYDVGFDFEAGAGGPVFTKSGFYGLF